MTLSVLSFVNQPVRASLLLFLAAVLGVGCNRDETAIRTYSAPKDAPAPQVAAAPEMPAEATGAEAPPPSTSEPITWSVPTGWKAVHSDSKMRYATFQVSPEDPKAQLTVMQLPAEAADVLPNVNRWAGQLKLPDVTAADVSKYVQPTQVSGEQASMVDMTGSAESGNPPTRLLAAIVPHGESAWFVTLKAAEPIAAAQKQSFGEFVRSIQFPTGPAASASPESRAEQAFGPSDQSFKLTKWKTPEGWQEQPGSNEFRVTSFRVGSGDATAELLVSRIPQQGIGSLLGNINRWREQVGLEPVTTDKDAGFRPVNVAGQPALFLSLVGPNADGKEPKQILVALTIRGADGWFFKMLGPESVVAPQQDAFRQFLDSLQFEPESH